MEENNQQTPPGTPPPGAPPEASPDPYPGVKLSQTWRNRFQQIDRVGGWDGIQPKRPKDGAPNVSFFTRFNFWAVLFGPFYYIVLGMWKKALFLCGAAFLLWFVLDVSIGLLFPNFPLDALANGQGAAWGVFYAMLVSRDYYFYKLHGETMWPFARVFDKPAVIIAAFATVLVLVFGTILVMPAFLANITPPACDYGAVREAFKDNDFKAEVARRLGVDPGMVRVRLDNIVDRGVTGGTRARECSAHRISEAGASSITEVITYEIRYDDAIGAYVMDVPPPLW